MPLLHVSVYIPNIPQLTNKAGIAVCWEFVRFTIKAALCIIVLFKLIPFTYYLFSLQKVLVIIVVLYILLVFIELKRRVTNIPCNKFFLEISFS